MNAALLYKRGTANINGGDLAYRLYPKGRSGELPLVLVSGWACVMNDWFSFPEELAKAGRTVLVFDNRGIGMSMKHPGEVSIEAMAADALALADALLPKGPFVAIGHSAGAFAVQLLAARHPDRVAASVMLAGQGARKTAVGGDPAFFKLGRGTWHDGKDSTSRQKLLSYFIDQESRDVLNRGFKEICKRSLKEKRSKDNIGAQIKALGKADFPAELAAAKCPALVIHGDQDKVIPVQNAQPLHDALSSSVHRRLVIVPGALHMPHAPSPEAARKIVAEVLDFIQVVEPPKAKL
eukprot:TRINITY_DN82519_c0_g1_i1.p1 TRINITY_DN82519_c0_g1~~TRINITY_DN82519_c0_g1_i1.p1  ORF type:complete len:294 (-),score=62.36 TRINITY_DN82519_c0_g1_i1:98-979(-)